MEGEYLMEKRQKASSKKERMAVSSVLLTICWISRANIYGCLC